MIAFLKGNIIQKTSNKVILDVGGVGYCAFIPLSTYLKLGETNSQAELYIYMHVTDNTLALYGFHSQEEKELFLKLIGISGIGPKIALNVLSGIETTDLKEAIQNSDVARISLIPGIGKKTAIRIALELQEKLEKKEEILGAPGYKEREDVVSALMNLGFKRKEVEKIVDDTIKTYTIKAGFDHLIKESLKRLAKM
ncbi:MAG: Holliday junction branch migration protein RuvA [Candidatus Aminicenantes bacterium]|nr:Holliday junction branch migration protein RuvA [Candidatus Aminicenantes bacterium]